MPSETGVVQAVSSLGPNWILGSPFSSSTGLPGGAVDHRTADLHQAHAAHAHRFHLGVIAEDRDVDAGRLGSIHHQRPFGNRDLAAVQ